MCSRAASGIVKCFLNVRLELREVSGLYPYEILVIIDPRPTDEEVAALLTRLGENLKGLGAEVGKVERWGKRDRKSVV